MKTCENFSLSELVPPDLYYEYKERGKLWKLWLLFDNRIMLAADIIREVAGPCVINDWSWSGDYTQSGLRLPGSPHYRLTSQHSWGRALDIKPQNYSVETLRQKIINREICHGLVTRLEGGVPWLHIDCGLAHPTGEIQVFYS